MMTRIVRASEKLAPHARLFADTLEPDGGARSNLVHVMIHGGMHSGNDWIVTPDGRPGWAPMLAERGDRVICLDWPGYGRSGYVPPEQITGDFVVSAICNAIDGIEGDIVLWVHSMSGPFGWKIAERLGGRVTSLVAIAPGPPGNIQLVADIISHGPDGTTVSFFGRPWRVPQSDVFPPERDFTHFKFVEGSTQFPHEAFDAYFAGLLGIPANLVLDRLNVGGRQLRIDDPERIAGTKIVIVTGGEDPDHAREVDEAIHRYFLDESLDSRFVFLPDHGIHGNGHMMMLERNNEDILNLVYEGYLRRHRHDR